MFAQPLILLDVIETIIDILATIDDQEFPSIKACSLTCRSFLHPSRKHIFASVSLDTRYQQYPFIGAPKRSSTQLKKLLNTTPEIANYVRKLGFGIQQASEHGNDEKSPEIAETLRQLTRVQHLSLDPHRPGMAPNWSNIATCLQDALFHLLSLPTLNSLSFYSLGIFPVPELAARCHNLRSLRISVLYGILDHISPALHIRSISLDEFFIHYLDTDITNQILTAKGSNGQPILNFTNLKKYYARCNIAEDIEIAQQILKRTNQLTSLELLIQHGLSWSGFAEPVLSSLRSLRKMHLQHHLYHSNGKTPLVGLPDQLRAICEGPNALEELEIGIYFAPVDAKWDTSDEWGKLDEVLNDSRWLSLKTVSIKLMITRSWLDTTDVALRTLPQKHFPLLSTSTDIIFNFMIKKSY